MIKKCGNVSFLHNCLERIEGQRERREGFVKERN